MPIYEYYCPDNNKIYSFYAKTLEQGQSIPSCPDNPAYKMVKMMSSFAITGAERKSSAGESAEGEAEGANTTEDARMMAAMAQMEKEMAGMDEDNPDPRQMAKLMRRMSEMTGEKLDDTMEEMVRKLEEGKDPEQLEEELGDMLPEEGDEGLCGGGGFGGAPPVRDPNLYDY